MKAPPVSWTPRRGDLWSAGGGIRAIAAAAALCLCSALAIAEEPPDQIPILSTKDGSRIWVEVTRSGNRAAAVPFVEISGEIVQKTKTAGEAGSRLLDRSKKDREKEVGRHSRIEDILKEHRSLLVREGPEGLSFGGAFTLLGDVQDGLKNGRTSREKLKAVVEALKDAHAREASNREAAEPDLTPTDHARSHLVVR